MIQLHANHYSHSVHAGLCELMIVIPHRCYWSAVLYSCSAIQEWKIQEVQIWYHHWFQSSPSLCRRISAWERRMDNGFTRVSLHKEGRTFHIIYSMDIGYYLNFHVKFYCSYLPWLLNNNW
jgi:hypothetical protein